MPRATRGRGSAPFPDFIKMESGESDDEGFMMGGIKLEEDAQMDCMPLKVVIDLVLAKRTPEYVDTIHAKLGHEGITEAKSLKALSYSLIQTKLGLSDSFGLGEVADILAVRDAIIKSCRRPKGNGCRFGSRGRGERNRSRSRDGKGGQRRGSRPCRTARVRARSESHGPGRRGRGGRRSPARRRKVSPPALWAAAARGDVEVVRQLLAGGKDVDEAHQLWTPLMKAAEEAHIEVAQLLLERGADVTATNKRGRDALSFAAAPSMKKPLKPEHTAMVRLLVEKGAEPGRKDERGQTARDRAQVEGREGTVRALQELEASSASARLV